MKSLSQSGAGGGQQGRQPGLRRGARGVAQGLAEVQERAEQLGLQASQRGTQSVLSGDLHLFSPAALQYIEGTGQKGDKRLREFALPQLATLVERPGRSRKPGGKGATGKRKPGRRAGVGGAFGMGRNNSMAGQTTTAPTEQAQALRNQLREAGELVEGEVDGRQTLH